MFNIVRVYTPGDKYRGTGLFTTRGQVLQVRPFLYHHRVVTVRGRVHTQDTCQLSSTFACTRYLNVGQHGFEQKGCHFHVVFVNREVFLNTYTTMTRTLGHTRYVPGLRGVLVFTRPRRVGGQLVVVGGCGFTLHRGTYGLVYKQCVLSHNGNGIVVGSIFFCMVLCYGRVTTRPTL